MAEPYGTIAKYRNTLAIKKHNALIQPWASAMAVDIAAVFWATWKGIEERLPEGDDIIEAEKPRDSRDLKNKYSAIIRVEVKRHSAEMQRVVEDYIYRVWLAGAVEQCRDLGCTGWFFSSLSKSSTSSESASTSDGTSLQESEIIYLGTLANTDHKVGVLKDDEGNFSYFVRREVNYGGGTSVYFCKFAPNSKSGVGPIITDRGQFKNAFVKYADDYHSTEIKVKKQGGTGIGYKNAKTAFDANSSGSVFKAPDTKTTTKTSSATKTKSVKADSSGWVSLPNLRAQSYAEKHAAEAVTNINDTTRKEIASIVSKGVASGASYNDIAKSIKSKFEEFAVPMPQKHIANRAVLVAVTELANAYCEGNNQVGQYLQDSGLQMMKAWQTLDDDRVSDGCNKNEQAGWILFKDKFPSGDIHPPRFPGCRCDYLIEMLDKDFLGKSINAFYSTPVKADTTTPKTTTPKTTRSVSGVYSQGQNLLQSKTNTDSLCRSLKLSIKPLHANWMIEQQKKISSVRGNGYKSNLVRTNVHEYVESMKLKGRWPSAIDYIVNKQGYAGLPTKISSDELDSKRALYRGVGGKDSETVKKYHSDLVDGDWYYSASSGAAHGRGMYTTSYLRDAESYASKRSSGTTIIEKMQFKKNANVKVVKAQEGNAEDLRRNYPVEMENLRKSYNQAFRVKFTSEEFYKLIDSDTFALPLSEIYAALGFDGYTIKKIGYTVVSNRTALEVVDDSI